MNKKLELKKWKINNSDYQEFKNILLEFKNENEVKKV